MDRKGTRGSKPKNVPPKDLYALGSKSSGSAGVGRSTSLSGPGQTNNEASQSQLSHEKSVHSSGYSKSSGSGVDRRESTSSVIIGKKAGAKAGAFHGPSGVSRPGPQKISTSDVTEGWENVAEIVETDDLIILLEAAEEKGDIEKIEALLCGAVKTLRSQRMKPDNILCLTLAYLVKAKPVLFHSSPLIIDAFCSLLKKGDFGISFKAKTNPSASVLAANILLAIFQDEKCWPETFIKAYIDDSLGERLWVDHEDCKGFVDNIIASFKTKIPPKSSLYPDHGITNRPDCPSPLSTSSGIESGDGDSELSLECKENLDVNIYNRYAHMTSEIEEMVTEAVQNQLNLRHQNIDAVARNFIRFLSTVTGIMEVRRAVAPKLEVWLQNHKHQRPAIELLMSMCLNCNTHSPIDQKVIGFIVHIRIKLKPLTNQYMACLRELLSAHPDNIASVIKETTFNELSPTRNASNMAILAVVFQYAPEHAAFILADIFLELLRNAEDFLRALRALLREIVRSLRHDMQYQKFCQGLMKDQKDAAFKDSFEFKERMFHSIVDLVVLTTFVSISPQIREVANMIYRGENRDLELIKRYQETVSLIQQDALYWMHRVVPKTYSPSKEEYVKSLHKLVMMDQPEVYYHKDNWPTEGDRPLYFRLASEVPLKQESLHRLLIIGTMKEQYIKPQEVLELADKLIKRATSLSLDLEMLCVEDTKIIDLIFNLCPYMPPENSPLPAGYRPPKTAIANLYWKAWSMLLLITAHNPSVFGVLAWERYPTLRVIMEMCITNSFIFPPPTMSIGDKGEEMNNQELLISAKERQQVLEFESHLAQKTITEQNSLLLSQLITMDPTGPARKPPPILMEQLKQLNSSNKIGHLLCRCRKPDFLVDIIQRQGAPQSMPWLAQLVESSEDAYSVLPVQCLCEFLLSETVVTQEGSIATRHQQLLQHLRCLLLSPRQDEDVSVEILEYFLRRLSSQQPGARTQAVRGLLLVVGPLTESMEAEPDKHEPYRWLLKHLPMLPGFPMIRSGACQALRAACQIETKPAAVSAYIRFLAVHTCEDSLQDMSALVQDMAQLIVERSTMISAILPSLNYSGPPKFPHAGATLNALFIIFINYMQGARIPSREIFASAENQDHVRIQWATGEQAVMHILVVHAMVILLISGPSAAPDLFHQLLSIWFPENQDMPQAFLVDTAQEALLLPDWLKLKMIRSTVPQLVDAALKDLEPSQLVLFIQSFGIPVASMTKLLCALDLAVKTNEEAVAAAVLDKSHKNYMAQLVEVQHQRGARGGHAFAATLGERDDDLPSEARSPFKPLITPLKPYGSLPIELSTNEVQSFVLQCFTCSSLHIEHKKQVKDTMRTLQQHLSSEISSSSAEKSYLNELLQSFSTILQSHHSSNFIKGLHQHCILSSPLFRLLLQMKERNECAHLYSLTVQVVNAILHLSRSVDSLLSPVLRAFSSTTQSDFPSSKSLAPVIPNDVHSEKVILEKLNQCQISELERLIRDLVEVAMREGRTSLVVRAIVQLLISEMKNCNQSPCLGQRIALFLDWLQIFDPELHFIPNNMIRVLLFSRISQETKVPKPSVSSPKIDSELFEPTFRRGYGQAYFLAAFTHQATWETIESTIHDLLKSVDLDLDPSSILDFIWAILHVPKLWQGRERRSPRHVHTTMPLILNSPEQMNLTQYILFECQKYYAKKEMSSIIQKRIKLLFYCLPDSSFDLGNIVKQLNSSKPTGENGNLDVCSHLVYQMYLQRPCIIKHLSKLHIESMMKVQEMTSNQGQSAADVSLHTLLTMLTSPLPGKDFLRRMYELDAAVRKMASQHPLLVIRHLSLLAATLQGLTHLNWSVFQEKNYVDLFSMVIGILELLQPYIFYPKYSDSFSKTIDSYIELFGEHGRIHELRYLLLRTCHLLMGWVGSRSSSASLYVTKHSSLFSSLLRTHSDMLPLRSLAAIAASKGTDHPKGDKISIDTNSFAQYPDETCLPLWHQQQASEIISHLEMAKTSEEQGDLRKVQDLSDNCGGRILPQFFHFISEGILSSEVENRKRSWNLLIQLLKRKPKMASQISRSVLCALNSEEVSVAVAGVKHLSRVILMLHEFSPDLLTAGFNASLYAEPEVGIALSEALYLLTINTGA